MLYELPYLTREWLSITSLNPYSNGICSMSRSLKSIGTKLLRLNPYSNGICSMRDVQVLFINASLITS